MAPASEGKPISSRNICSQCGKRAPSEGGWEQMEQESFSSSCHRPTAGEAHHPSPCFPLLSLQSCTVEQGWQKHLNCSLCQGYPSLTRCQKPRCCCQGVPRVSHACRATARLGRRSQTAGKVRTVSASGGGSRRG